MGLSLIFLAGNKDKIISSIMNEEEEELLESLQTQNLLADFSFHLEPGDLDTLLLAICNRYKKPDITLRENLDLDESLYYDTEYCGAYYIKPPVRKLFASLSAEDAKDISELWYQDLSLTYNEDLRPAIEVSRSIAAMIRLCHTAELNYLDIVHYWSL